MGVILVGYISDALLLLGFAIAGTITYKVPCFYAAAGLIQCAIFAGLSSRAIRKGSTDRYLALPLGIASIAIQLLFIVLAPPVALCFLAVLITIVSFSTMAISPIRSVMTWMGVSVAVFLLLIHSQGRSWIPPASTGNWALMFACFVLTLGRGILLGVFNSTLMIRFQNQSLKLSESLEALKQRDHSLQRVNAELQHQATHDALTGLPNRLLFAERLEQAVSQQRSFAVAVLDLDRFKVINDSLGHGAGDALLKLVARRLLTCTRADDTVARAGGDEFLLLMRDISSVVEIETLAQRCVSALGKPYRIDDNELQVSPSIGIARFPIDAIAGEELLAHADEAMYHAKQSGRNTFRFFDTDVMGFSRERLTMETDLRQAIASSQFQLHYQPKVDVATGETRSVEALLRWQHPTRGILLPAEFIPIAEDTGLILPIGTWVIREACRQAREWQLQGLPFLRVAVNVSPTQFRQTNLPNLIREALETHKLDPSLLEIELTESTLMNNAERSVAMLEQISKLGVVVAIDDFGTGYSSMSYLQRLPVDKLKIDMSFIRNLETNPGDVAIVRAIISLAHGLRLKVVAEGVESAAQLDLLNQLGCEQYQGFYSSPAVPAAQVAALVFPAGADTVPAIDRTFAKLARLFRAQA